MEQQRHYHISCHGLKVNGGMLTAKNSKADFKACKACILLDGFATNAPRGNFVKNAFQNVSKSEKISEHEAKDYHNKTLEKARNFVITFEDPDKAVTHDKHENDKYQKNLRILKLIIEEVICSEQEIAFRGHREQSNYTESYHEKRKLYCNNKHYYQT